jgi:hypothetical protein
LRKRIKGREIEILVEGRREGVDLYGVRRSNVEEGHEEEWTEGGWNSWRGFKIRWNSWRGFKINFRGGREGNYGKGALLVYMRLAGHHLGSEYSMGRRRGL